MADLSITAANVVPDAGYSFTDSIAGEAITAGQTVYRSSSDSKIYKAQCDNASHDDVLGIALNGASASQPIRVMTSGTITIGATVTVGEIYVLSATAGGIAPEGDLVSTNYVTLIGIGTSSTKILLNFKTSSVQVP